MKMQRTFIAVATVLMSLSVFADGDTTTSTNRNVAVPAQPEQVHLGGLLGERFAANIRGRLLKISEDEMLNGFRRRPGSHPWIGEHVGKWLHAAAASWLNAKDVDPTVAKELRDRMDRVVRELIATQEPDGYLGTYAPDHRMGRFGQEEWDVWVHKYAIIGLLAYHDATGSTEALAAAHRAADLLVNTFPVGGKDINETSQHAGMASTSVLEPIVLMYRKTGEKRYLDLAERIVAAWDTPTGAGIVSRLLKDKSVLTVGNRKAYEMLSCLVGVCELYRATGKSQYLEAAKIAWDDVARNHLYITGSGSVNERWTENHHMPLGNDAKICEGCVTATWMQLSMQLLALTGEARYIDELERSIYNHLLGAQRPSGEEFCYYTPLEGKKPYSSEITCCFSSGARGISWMPSIAFATGSEQGKSPIVYVNLLGESHATLALDSANTVSLEIGRKPGKSGPKREIAIQIRPSTAPQRFKLMVRVPPYMRNVEYTVGSEPARAVKAGWLEIEREWAGNDMLVLALDMAPQAVKGTYEQTGRVAFTYGPMVFVAEETEGTTTSLAASRPEEILMAPGYRDGAPTVRTVARDGQTTRLLELVPFYVAGAKGAPIRTYFELDKAPK